MKPIQRFFLYCFYCTLAYFTKDSTGYADDVYYAHKCCVDSSNKLVPPEKVPETGCSIYIYPGEKTSNNSDWCKAGYFIPATETDDTRGFHQLCYDSFVSFMGADYKTGEGPGNSECNYPGDKAVDPDKCSCSYYTGTCFSGSGVECPKTGACKWSCKNQILCTDNTIDYDPLDGSGNKCPAGYYLATKEDHDYTNNPNAACYQSDNTWKAYCRPCPTGQYRGNYKTRAFESELPTGRHGIETCAVFKVNNGISDQYGYFVFSNPQDLDGEIGCSYQGIPINEKEEIYKESGTGQDY